MLTILKKVSQLKKINTKSIIRPTINFPFFLLTYNEILNAAYRHLQPLPDRLNQLFHLTVIGKDAIQMLRLFQGFVVLLLLHV